MNLVMALATALGPVWLKKASFLITKNWEVKFHFNLISNYVLFKKTKMQTYLNHI